MPPKGSCGVKGCTTAKRDGIPVYKGPGIYRITCLITRKIYIGSAESIYRRLKYHRTLLRTDKHPNIYLQRAWHKYREEAFIFDFVESCPLEKLIEREQFWLDSTQSYDQHIGYNICKVAGSRQGTTHSEETKAKISAAKKGKKLTAEHRAKMSEAQKLRGLDDEENKEKLRQNHWTKLPTAEISRQKISEKNKGQKRTPEQRANIAAGRRAQLARKREAEAKRQELLRLMKEQNG